ncbi:hypothetical protein HQ576_16780, partial [bacterium]|nr:hypothetical protein [bacterium]
PKAADESPAPRTPGGAGPAPEGGQYRFGGQDDRTADNEAIAPLDGPNPPALFDEPSPMEQAVRALKDAASDSEGSAKDDEKAQAAMNAALQQFSAAVTAASGQKSEWEDMRQDLLTHMLRAMDFCTGPIEGSPTDGHEVSIQLDGDRMAGGEIFDRAVEPSEDIAACDKLLDQSADVAEALRRTLYPNVEELPVTTHLRSSGTLDPARLAMAAFSDVVYKRHRIEEHADRRGRPLLLIACDGSGSLDERQMQMVKVLATAWLTSTAKSQVQVLAALYHSGSVRRGVTGPLVQWIYHPQKTPAIPRTEAARAVVTLPNTGTGVQSDALSLAFLMDEAFRVARGRMVYLILISDCEWNQSFGKERSGEQEVQAVFEATYDQHPNKLHATLVALGVDGETNFEDLLEKVIAVPEAELTNSAAVAERIGTYVARCMKERHDLLARR